MVARGDLGVEIGVSQVPLVQKRIIERARAAGRAVITATQMLESMIHEPEPTRAEVSDVANAILDGTSAVMLSAETAAGAFPLRAVAQMDAIARSVEPSLVYERRVRAGADIAEILTHGACDLADDVGAPVIAVSTETGATARLVSRFRPQGPIVAAAKNAGVLQQLALEWAVVPLLVDEPPSIEAGWADIIGRVLEHGLAQPGDTIVLTGRADVPARRLDEPRLPPPRRRARGRDAGSGAAPRPPAPGAWRARGGRRWLSRPTSCSGASAARSTSTTSARSSGATSASCRRSRTARSSATTRSSATRTRSSCGGSTSSGRACTRTRPATPSRRSPPACPRRTSSTAGRT